MFALIKIAITAILVFLISEIAKRSSLLAAALASLPLTTILAMIWLYLDTRDAKTTAQLSTSVFWMILPSLFFFLIFPILVKQGVRFFPALIVSCIGMAAVYWGYTRVLSRFGIEI